MVNVLLILSSKDVKHLFFEKYMTGKPFILVQLDISVRQQSEDDLQLKSKASLKPIKRPLNIFNLSPLIQSAADQQLYQSY